MILESLLNLIYPPVCGFCDTINNKFICNSCYQKYNELKISNIQDYKNDPVYFDELFYMFKYEKDIREKIIKYKFDEHSYMYKSFAKLISDDKLFINEYIKKYDFITSVPIHKNRFKTRGYNQSELIAKELCKLCGKQYIKKVLEKNKNIVAQSSLDKLERVRNIKEAFSLGENGNSVKNKRIVIVDDVFTTGATVNECAKVLKEAGAKYVGIVAVAKS